MPAASGHRARFAQAASGQGGRVGRYRGCLGRAPTTGL